MALGKRNKQKKKFKPPALMLTSMMDMFTIILIFLLFSFSSNPEKLNLTNDLELPKSSSQADYSKAVKLILSQKQLLLDDEVILTLEGNELPGMSDEDPESSALFKKLKAYREKAKAESEATAEGETAEAPHILFMCDKSHNFTTINRVIKTAGLAGYPNFQFAVLEGKQE